MKELESTRPARLALEDWANKERGQDHVILPGLHIAVITASRLTVEALPD